MTEELFRLDSYLKTCTATVTGLTDSGIILDKTVFYPTGGGQPGDTGDITGQDGHIWKIIDTRKDRESGHHVHLVAEGTALPAIGDMVTATIDWDRRYRLMRMHTAMHLLCAVVPAGVTGGQVGEEKSRLDFDLSTAPEGYELDKEAIGTALNALIDKKSDVSMNWISDEEMDSQPDLVRTMSVQPPRGAGKVRLIKVGDIDLQPCGGTHVANIAEIGPVLMGKIESKGKRNKRINIRLETAS